MDFRDKPPRVQAYMLGYYTALQDTNKALIDIPLDSLSYEYRNSLSKKALRETQHIVFPYKNRKRIRGSKTVDKQTSNSRKIV